MTTKRLAIILVMMFWVSFSLFSHAQTIQDSVEIMEYKLKEIDCGKYYDGLKAEICIKEAWLEYQQKRNVIMSIKDQDLTERDMRDHLVDKNLIDDMSLTGRELNELRKRYYQERWQMEQDYKKESVSFDEDIAYCRFQKVEDSLKNTVMYFARRYPDSIVVRDAMDEKGYVRGKVNARKSELANAENAASMAMADGAKSREFCVAWDVPPNLISADVLIKCRPKLIAEMKQVSELSKRAEMGFKQFKAQREDSLKDAQKCVDECRDLQGSLERLRSLNPYPYSKCAEYMLRQEAGPDAVDYAKRNLESKLKDLQTRWQRTNQILAGGNEVILRCDWNALERMKSDALKNLPEENCIRNYSDFARLREAIYDLDRKKQVRWNEVRILGEKIFQRVKYAEGFIKAIGVRDSQTWDANAIQGYNQERQGLEYLVKEAYTQGYNYCLQDLIAKVNTLPLALQVPEKAPPRARMRFDNPTWQGRRLDRCLSYAQNCDEPAATEFCRRNQYQKAIEWKWGPSPHTRTLFGQNCDTPTNCGGFIYIVCE
jgi:hypothetical protein